MLSLKNGTIQVADDKIVLVIKKDDYEEFKKYKNVDKSGAIIDDKFYVGCTLNDQQLYITGSYPQEELGDNTIMNVKSVGKKEIMVKALSCHPTVQLLEEKNVKTTELEAAEEQLKGKNEELEAAKKKAEEELRTKTQELQDQLDTAQQEKQDLEAEVEKLKVIDSTALQQQLEEKNAKITELEALDAKINTLTAQIEEQKQQVDTLAEEKAKAQVEELNTKINTLTAQIEEQKQQVDTLAEEKAKIDKLNAQVQQLKDMLATKFDEVANLNANLTVKDKKITQLKTQKVAVEKEKADLQTKLAQANEEKEKLEAEKQKAEEKVKQLQQKKTDLQTKFNAVEKEKQALKAKNKTPEQPKQGNGARYTATVGMGLAAGLVAFTALERTVRLEMLVMIGIAVTSALVFGGITYAVLPGTQVDGAKAQEVNENGKSK